jgi:hypothetical protein
MNTTTDKGFDSSKGLPIWAVQINDEIDLTLWDLLVVAGVVPKQYE